MVGRSHFEHRLSLVGNSKEMEAGLDEFLAQKEEETSKFSGGAKRYYTSTTNAPAKISLFFLAYAIFFFYVSFDNRSWHFYSLPKTIYTRKSLQNCCRVLMQLLMTSHKSWWETNQFLKIRSRNALQCIMSRIHFFIIIIIFFARAKDSVLLWLQHLTEN